MALSGTMTASLVSPRGRVMPVVTIVAAIIVLWYALAVLLNWPQVTAMMANNNQTATTPEIIGATWAMERPILPSPHQVIAEFWKTTVGTAPTSKRSLIYHAWITASATMLGFVFGAIRRSGIVWKQSLRGHPSPCPSPTRGEGTLLPALGLKPLSRQSCRPSPTGVGEGLG